MPNYNVTVRSPNKPTTPNAAERYGVDNAIASFGESLVRKQAQRIKEEETAKATEAQQKAIATQMGLYNPRSGEYMSPYVAAMLKSVSTGFGDMSGLSEAELQQAGREIPEEELEARRFRAQRTAQREKDYREFAQKVESGNWESFGETIGEQKKEILKQAKAFKDMGVIQGPDERAIGGAVQVHYLQVTGDEAKATAEVAKLGREKALKASGKGVTPEERTAGGERLVGAQFREEASLLGETFRKIRSNIDKAKTARPYSVGAPLDALGALVAPGLQNFSAGGQVRARRRNEGIQTFLRSFLGQEPLPPRRGGGGGSWGESSGALYAPQGQQYLPFDGLSRGIT